MNDLVIMKEQQAVTSSLQVSETFGKNHHDVLDAIDNLTQENHGVKNMFSESLYTNSRGRQYRQIFMNRDGFTLLAMGFTGTRALGFKLKYIDAFNQMERQIEQTGGYQVPTNMAEALRLAADQAEQIEVLKPKALFADAVATSHTSILVGDLAKILKQNGIETGTRRLFNWLREQHYLISRKGADYNSPTQRSMELGLFEIKESTHINGDGVTVTTKTPKVTGKGQNYFINRFIQAN
ncbi:phage anti-repressor protein [Paucilactobacillus hokkaidonensis JCM 18461]|uniref:Phage anti-repressor protein n=2 Tax=Paucilactobacillus hokkaidonensis TaxID=1193095 RepID=A0A0A1GT61_9LACO|nr:phage antirepressor KilAC domain-containing protein [Paucilactobacillus hokkaidonensis]KRO06676.1 phage-related antirepressor [Paucilactobacillus hokkaidonensis]BAP85492.1 phage anti-repressor protein [Paucilactobacillus hokkaidonensis JCM 18461]